MNEWHDLFMAAAGSAAALTGLIFVGVSINLGKILAFPSLPNRALLSLVFLMTILVLSIFFLVPGQHPRALGVETLCTSLLTWAIVISLDLRNYSSTKPEFRKQYLTNVIINQLAILPFFVAGFLISFSNEQGMFWMVPGILLCFAKGVLDAWVLLIEINR
jgi:hypothetical protein